mmetsp:Transcript_17952/g.49664  ORF Transcript_17952/g.49664 Transcript_17952/m.49664 type:complete len:181 (+) Transcript_17952:2-544(+)
MTAIQEASRPKVKLSPQQAREIFSIQATKTIQKHSIFQRDLSAAAVARHFGVTEKAVRDIWKGRTWRREIGDSFHQLSPCTQLIRSPHTKGTEKWMGSSSNSIHNNALGTAAQFTKDMNDNQKDGPNNDSRRAYEDMRMNDSTEERKLCFSPGNGTAHPVFELPSSKCQNDPFHDDWPFW